MAVYMMTDADKAGKANVEIWLEYSGHIPHHITHDHRCPHYDCGYYKQGADTSLVDKTNEAVVFEDGTRYWLNRNLFRDCHENCSPRGPLFMEVTYVGCVISDHERNMRDDSDFYCYVWDEPTQSIKQIEYATTRGWTYPNLTTSTDATPEVLEKVRVYREKAKAEAERRAKILSRARIAKAAITEVKERIEVEVVKGRKVPRGIKGRVEVIRENEWGPKAMIRTVDGASYWTAPTNLKPVATPEQIEEYNAALAIVEAEGLACAL